MKKVWILERFATAEEEAKHYAMFVEMVKNAKSNSEITDEQLAELEKTVAIYKKVVDENPNGRWYGSEGKVIYHQFCNAAKAAIRRNPEEKFRVVEGEIDDDAETWLGYKTIKVNDGVYRYLMATK